MWITISFVFSDVCHFQKLAEENTAATEFDFNWNSMPTVVGECNSESADDSRTLSA